MNGQDLDSILTALQQSPDNRTRFDEGWTQGRSAYGGLSSALAVTAMRKLLPSPRPLRSLMVSFIAPIPAGEVQVQARIQRQGKNVSQLSADLITGGDTALQAMGVFGNPRPALHVPAAVRKDLPPKESDLPLSAETRRLPSFLQYFDGYWLDGAVPFSGNKDPKLAVWLRHKAPLARFPDERIISMADMPPPAILSYFTKPPVPASSVTWCLEFVVPPERVEDEWLYLEYVAEAAADGYSQQTGRIYDESGRLCLLSSQCMVYFG